MPKSKKAKHNYGKYTKCPNQLCDFTFTTDRAIQLHLHHSKHCAVHFSKQLANVYKKQTMAFQPSASIGG